MEQKLKDKIEYSVTISLLTLYVILRRDSAYWEIALAAITASTVALLTTFCIEKIAIRIEKHRTRGKRASEKFGF